MQDARQSTLPGETSDFEYQPTEAGNLQLEVFNTRLKMKVGNKSRSDKKRRRFTAIGVGCERPQTDSAMCRTRPAKLICCGVGATVGLALATAIAT
jgi:hypothetical protein